MKSPNIYRFAVKAMAIGTLAGAFFTSCEEDKLLTTDFDEVYIPNKITLDVSEILPVGVGMDTTLTFSVEAPEKADKSIVFLSSNESVATVSQDGTIHGVAVGEATITCTLPIGFGPSGTVKVNVIPEVIKAQSISITNTTELGEEGKIYETDELQLVAEILPADHTYDRIIWSSSNPSVASVDEKGLVKCLSVGKTKITAMTTDRSGVSASYDIAVEEYIAVQEISVQQPAEPMCIVGGNVALDVTYTPANATKGSVDWKSGDESIVTVHRGVVTPVGFGSTTITGTCKATGQSVTVTVEVPNGWYVWDKNNSWTGTGANNSWICANTQASEERGDVWRVYFPDAGTGKWRRDIKLNCSNNAMFPMHASMPVLAIRCTIPRGGNNSWDVRDSGNPKDNNGYDLSDGTRMISIDLTSKFQGWGTGFHDFNLFQLKVADIPNANVDPSAAYYDIYWIRTFSSIEEAQKFADEDAKNNPKN